MWNLTPMRHILSELTYTDTCSLRKRRASSSLCASLLSATVKARSCSTSRHQYATTSVHASSHHTRPIPHLRLSRMMVQIETKRSMKGQEGLETISCLTV
jgi:hypothetical protein